SRLIPLAKIYNIQVVIAEIGKKNHFYDNTNNTNTDYIFGYLNNYPFNRGWACNMYKYTCASDWVCFFDVDIFVDNHSITRLLTLCNNTNDVISPYRNINYTTQYEKNMIMKDEKYIKKV